MEVTPEESKEIQRLVLKNGGSWDFSEGARTKSNNILYILKKGLRISWETCELKNSKEYETYDSKEFIRSLTEFPVYKIHRSGDFIVEFDAIKSGKVIYCKTAEYRSGEFSDEWIPFYFDFEWKDVDIDKYINTDEQCGESVNDEFTLNKRMIIDDAGSGAIDITPSSWKFIEDTANIKPGTIVLATRKSTNENYKDYTWQGVYFGYCNGKHLVDANTTHVQLADEIQMIQMLTKKEAKQKISELFANPKNATAEKVRNIIDLIKD